MKTTFLKGVALGSAVSLVALAATAAFAGTGVGKVFNLGQDNRVNARSQLEGATPSAVLNVTNTDKSAAASGVSVDVPAGNPPLVVNSATKVKNLNADLLDGRDAGSFQSATSKSCPNGSAISSIASNGATACDSPIVIPLVARAQVNVQSARLDVFAPSTLQLSFYCVDTYAGINVFNTGSAPAVLTYSCGGNLRTPYVGTYTFPDHGPYEIEDGVSATVVGQLDYLHPFAVVTINFTGTAEGADGCLFTGTIVIARK